MAYQEKCMAPDVKTPNKSESICFKSFIPKKRQELLKWNGWGYQDSKFQFKDGVIWFNSRRYPIGNLELPYFTKYVRETFGVFEPDPPFKQAQSPPTEKMYPTRVNADHIKAVTKLGLDYSTDVVDRIVRAHGQTLHEIYTLREGKFERIPDLVVWPKSHGDVVRVVELAHENNLVIIQFGGGTAVSGAVECTTQEPRCIVVLDTSQMNRIIWVDQENLNVCCESGIVGQDLERVLGGLGYTTGHEPDSYEFSSLGGWVATRASGMKKNIYGNIEDLVVHVRMVTPRGVLEKNCQVPRMSCGPDFNHLILGSEGCLGVITEVVLKIRPLPEQKRFGSIVFPDFEAGVKCMREIARKQCQPASVRLMDNEQFKFGQSLKTKPSFLGAINDSFKKLYVIKWKNFDVQSMCVMTLLFEGNQRKVDAQEKQINDIAAGYDGLPAGEHNGFQGYMLTFVIAYIRDLGLEYGIVAESLETSVPWDKAVQVCKNVKHAINIQCGQRGIAHCLSSCRVTQTYDAGCVIYFYFGFRYVNQDPVCTCVEIVNIARKEIFALGGSISHHHGVGKLRRRWYSATVSKVGVALFNAVKRELDPRNVFAIGNFVETKL